MESDVIAVLAEWIMAFTENITHLIGEMLEARSYSFSLRMGSCSLDQANVYTIYTVDPEPRYILYREYLSSQRGHKMESMVTGIM